MSILYTTVLLLIFVCCFVNFKRTVLIYAPLKLLFHNGILIIDNNSGSITLDGAISTIIILFFVLIYARKHNLTQFIFKIPLILYSLHLAVYYLHPDIRIPRLMMEWADEVGFTIVFYYMLNSKYSISLFVKYFIIVAYILMINGFLELIMGYNPLREVIEANSGSRLWWSDNSVARFGMPRITSFMPHSISFGFTCTIFIVFLLFVIVECPQYIRWNTGSVYFLLALLFIGVILSNSRTSLLGLTGGIFLFINKKTFSGKRGIIIITGVGLFLLFFQGYLQFMYDTIFNENKVDVQGSTSELRDSQFSIALYYLLESPLLGMGYAFDITKYQTLKDVEGMESIWFILMYKHGLLGILTYSYLFIFCFLKFIKLSYYKYIISFLIMWLISITFSSQVGYELSLYFLIIVIVILQIEKQKKLKLIQRKQNLVN